MKKFKGMFTALLCAAIIAVPAVSYAGGITVFAAASMTESLNKIAGMYKKAAPNTKIVYNFDSSGTLKTQIQQGAPCDIFISAGQKQMNQLDIKADPKVNTEKLDFVMPGTRFNIVSNRVVLIVPKGHNTTGIKDFKDAMTDKVKLIALGNSDVPVGQYSTDIFKSLGIWDKLNADKKITFGSNVKEVLAQVEAGAVSCGVVYSTDAATAKKGTVEIVAEAPAGSHKPIVYPAAVMKNAKNAAEAKAFCEFLKNDACKKVFESIGFSIPKK